MLGSVHAVAARRETSDQSLHARRSSHITPVLILVTEEHANSWTLV